MKGITTYYAKCPKCKDYYEEAQSLDEAKEKVEKHEAEKHKGKEIGIFGIDYGND